MPFSVSIPCIQTTHFTSGILVWMSRPFGIYKQTTMKCACVKDIPISPHQEWSGGNGSQQRQASSSFAQPCYNNKNTHCTGRTRLVSRTAWNGVYSRLGESSQGYYASCFDTCVCKFQNVDMMFHKRQYHKYVKL
jgi:hypothetical protein